MTYDLSLEFLYIIVAFLGICISSLLASAAVVYAFHRKSWVDASVVVIWLAMAFAFAVPLFYLFSN